MNDADITIENNDFDTLGWSAQPCKGCTEFITDSGGKNGGRGNKNP